MSVEEIIYTVLIENLELKDIFNGNILPLTSKKNILPCMLYQVYQVETNATKTSKSLKDDYILKLHIFSEDYKLMIDSVNIIKELLDFKELTDSEDNIIIDLIRFQSYTDEYEELPELYNRTLQFQFHQIRN
ncbi:hypothetical protein P872_18495 [Rhodonellum psychrophilum GCM71 = DSM 17998]|uniref:DUF3168 domain-containing protein n=2 Tax=Rhodonellum TaxID=336827 RepID=U5C0F8_9BACT|nr:MULTISPECIES: hypothetical protein [Rhodonellum]ERM82386.1 hypothetical protein P872_18495 [Rhodonellum psychrophilum GCM71 = DSM 17998]SDZ35659.1 hypothetical protein SAMN05444412_11155 [Rhodonellum ikkaensis]